jgi:hypothetical protein
MPGRARRLTRCAVRLVALSGLALTLTSCASAIGVVAVVGVVGVGLLTHKCYDYLDVTVYDSTGRTTCNAEVLAEQNGDSVHLTSCYYTPLGDGTWTLRARYPGMPDVTSTVIVDHSSGCVGHVQSATLTLAAPIPRVLPAPSSYELPPPPPPPPAQAAPPLRSVSPPPAAPAPTAPGTAPAPATPPVPAPTAAPPAPAPPATSSKPPSAAFPVLPAAK